MLNTKYKIRNTKVNGFTLIEALTLLFIFSLITLSFYNVISVGTRYIQMSKNRLGAVALANERMEIARNLNYNDVGIIGGSCSGNIPQEENVTRGGKRYLVRTMAAFADDPFDGTLGGSPSDSRFKDYKIVEVNVSWNNSGTDQGDVSLVSRFVPYGLEAASSGDGILSINVFSDQGEGGAVSQASVHITNADLGFSETRQTDSSGNIMIVGAGESINRYALTVTKSGYETVNTYIPYPDTDFNPVDTHASVMAGELNTANIVQNRTADIIISTEDLSGNPVGDIDFQLIGGRKIGTAALFPFNSIYNFNQTEETDSNGEKGFDSVSPGQYNFLLDPAEDEYKLVGIDPASPFSVLSEDDFEITAKVAPKNVASLSVTVKSSFDQSPISGAQVRLSREGYEKTIETGADGMVFFPAEGDPVFEPEIYDLEITAEGFQDGAVDGIEIKTGELKEEAVLLNIPDPS